MAPAKVADFYGRRLRHVSEVAVGEQAYAQATLVAGASVASVEDMINVVKREDLTTTVEPGVVVDVDIANVI